MKLETQQFWAHSFCLKSEKASKIAWNSKILSFLGNFSMKLGLENWALIKRHLHLRLVTCVHHKEPT